MMEFDAPGLDPEFIFVDTDAPLAEVLDLLGDLTPEHVVIRDEDEDEDVFYVLEPRDLVAADAAGATNIGEALHAAEAAPAPAFEWSDVPLTGSLPELPADVAAIAPSGQ